LISQIARAAKSWRLTGVADAQISTAKAAICWYACILGVV
jgi:hypothetical protein